MTERWRNPWPREWTDYDEDGDAITLDGTAMDTTVSLGWDDIESAAEDRDHIERSALRIRAGARHACARLRARNQRLSSVLSSYLAQSEREFSWARDSGITYEAVREILGRLDGEEISFGKAVELLRTLAVAAAGKEIRDVAATRAIEKWLDVDYLERSIERYEGKWRVYDAEDDFARCVIGGEPKATGATMSALCAALGIEVEGG